MKILLVSFEFPPYTLTGGIGSYMFHLANLLNENNYEVSVFSACPGGEKVTTEIKEAYRHYCIPAENEAAFRINAADYFDEYIKNNRVDVIESPEVGACAIGIKRKYPSIPLVVKMHTPGVMINRISRYYQPFTTKMRFVAGALLRGKFDAGYWSRHDKNKHNDEEYLITSLADAVLSPSVALKEWAVHFWQIKQQKITVIPNPFTPDSELFNYPIEGRPKQITFVGKLSVLKGMISFTEAIPAILDKNPGYKLVMVGRDTIEDGKSMLKYMKIKLSAYMDRIVFTGALPAPEVNKIYSASRICIFPSLWENYRNVVLEAMAAGAAVAGSSRGGIQEMISDHRTGVLFDPTQPNEISDKVNLLLQNDKHFLQIAYKARKELKNKLNDRIFIEKILSPYSIQQSQL